MIRPSVEQQKLKELEQKILLAKGDDRGKRQTPDIHRNVHLVWRMVLELVIGMVMGVGIGYALDNWLGTEPLMIITMSLFGFGAGIRTMMKTASELSVKEAKQKLEE